MTYRVRHPEMHQEDDTVRVWHIALGLGTTLAIGAIMVVLALWLIDGHLAELRPSGAFPERHLGPRHALARVREDVFGEKHGRPASEDERAKEDLSSYGWVDRGHGVVHIPVDRAIDLLVAGRRP